MSAHPADDSVSGCAHRESSHGLAVKALLAAVENTSSNEYGRDDYNCKAFVRLFEPSKRIESLIVGQTNKQQQSLLCSALKSSFSKNQLKRLFNNLRALTEKIIEDEAFIPSSLKESHEEDDEEPNDQIINQQSLECLLFLKYVALCAHTVLNGRIFQQQKRLQEQFQDNSTRTTVKKTVKMMSQVFAVASNLHDILFALHTCGAHAESTKLGVIALCECWWLANADHREALIAQCLPLLVLKACEDPDCFTSKTHILRLFKIREAFHCIDFAEPSSDSLRQLLMRVASNPLCLKVSEGRKFMASLFQEVHLVHDLHLAFRAQIPEAKKSILESYGEIYYRAWKAAKENSKDDDNAKEEDESAADESISVCRKIEHEVLQDLMHAVLHVASQSTFQSLLTVLEPLHVDKKSKDVANLLHRLYSPILWRSLRAANPGVRKNAVSILGKVFPLNDPLVPQSQEKMKEAVLKATEALQNLLKDSDPAVRVAASTATAKIFAVFWDALLPTEIRALLNLIVIDHSSDVRSAAVRAASLDAASVLLGVKQSHGVLRALLPSLGNLIHDKAEKVRLAAVKMLLQVKQTQGIRFYHVVPVNHLLARMVAEAEIHNSACNPVTKELTALMLNSYFPQGQEMSASQQLKRTLTFLSTDPEAASVFYANLSCFLDVESVVKFIFMLFTCVKTAVETNQASQVEHCKKTKKRCRKGSSRESADFDEVIDPEGNEFSERLSSTNTSLMSGLAKTINVMWGSIHSSLDTQKYGPTKKLLEDCMAGKDSNLLTLLSHFELMGIEYQGNEKNCLECFQVCSSLLDCASRLDRNYTAPIIDSVTASLHNLASETSECLVPMACSYLCFMSATGCVELVAKILASSIESSFDEGDVNLLSPAFEKAIGARRSRRSSLKNSNESNYLKLMPVLAWNVFERILQGINPECTKLRDLLLSSEQDSANIKKSLRKGIKLAERILESPADFGRNFTETEVEYAIRSCEVYGRFILHEASSASFENETEMSVNHQLELLLKWTSEKVVPVLLESKDETSMLRDLDLSHISSVSESFHEAPGSPSLTSPPKQKANLGRTPETMRAPSSLFPDNRNDNPVILSEKLAASLLVSSVIISSELLATGVSSSEGIAEASINWCKVFERKCNSLGQNVMLSFIRLAIQLIRGSGDHSLLEHLIVLWNDCVSMNSSEGVMMKRALASLIRLRGGVNSLMSTFFATASRLIEDEYEMQEFESADSLDDIWTTDGSFRILLGIITESSNTAPRLAEALVKKLSTCDKINATVRFQAKCLSYLFKTVNRAALSTAIGELEGTMISRDGDLRLFVESLLESHA